VAQARCAGEVRGRVRVIGHEQKERCLHGALELRPDDTPFPWQKKLLDRFIDSGVPDAVDIPIGLGKTFILEPWLGV
jgi:hypothetical protein